MMGRILHRRAALRGDKGAVTVPTVVFLPVLFMLFIFGAEAGIHGVRAAFMSQALDRAMRELRLGTLPVAVAGQAPTLTDIKKRICFFSKSLDCMNSLTISLEPKAKRAFVAPTNVVPCVDKAQKINPATTFNLGAESELMLVRACLKVPKPLAATVGFKWPLDGAGEYAIRFESAFVNEPN